MYGLPETDSASVPCEMRLQFDTHDSSSQRVGGRRRRISMTTWTCGPPQLPNTASLHSHAATIGDSAELADARFQRVGGCQKASYPQFQKLDSPAAADAWKATHVC